jgi:hypothetical protein
LVERAVKNVAAAQQQYHSFRRCGKNGFNILAALRMGSVIR